MPQRGGHFSRKSRASTNNIVTLVRVSAFSKIALVFIPPSLTRRILSPLTALHQRLLLTYIAISLVDPRATSNPPSRSHSSEPLCRIGARGTSEHSPRDTRAAVHHVLSSTTRSQIYLLTASFSTCATTALLRPIVLYQTCLPKQQCRARWIIRWLWRLCSPTGSCPPVLNRNL